VAFTDFKMPSNEKLLFGLGGYSKPWVSLR